MQKHRPATLCKTGLLHASAERSLTLTERRCQALLLHTDTARGGYIRLCAVFSCLFYCVILFLYEEQIGVVIAYSAFLQPAAPHSGLPFFDQFPLFGICITAVLLADVKSLEALVGGVGLPVLAVIVIKVACTSMRLSPQRVSMLKPLALR